MAAVRNILSFSKFIKNILSARSWFRGVGLGVSDRAMNKKFLLSCNIKKIQCGNTMDAP
jgi:hypothetical protein